MLLETDHDVVVAFITSRVTDPNDDTGIILSPEDPEFGQTGLKLKSLIRMDKIATLEKDLIIGVIGSVGNGAKNEVNMKVCRLYHL